MTLHEAAAAVGVSYGQYVKLERGERRLTDRYIMQASKGFGVLPEEILVDPDGERRRSSRNATDRLPYAGETQAGVWRDVELYSNHAERTAAIRPDPRYQNAKQYVWQVLGDSMDKAGILDGMFAVGVDYVDFVEHYRPVESGDIVVVERLRFGGQERERTIKRYWQEEAGIALMPESTNPHHKPLFIPNDGEIEGEEFKILAYVTGAYNLFGKAIYDLDEGQKIPL